MIQEYEMIINNRVKNAYPSNTISTLNAEPNSLIINLKKQIHALQIEVEAKDAEIENVKKNCRATHMQELEVELESYKDETIRLRNLYNKSLQLE